VTITRTSIIFIDLPLWSKPTKNTKDTKLFRFVLFADVTK